MADFHRRVATEAATIHGVVSVSFLSRGYRYSDHPHLAITLTTGEVFDYALRGRPIDGCTGYFKSIVGAIRREVRTRLGELAAKAAAKTKPKRKRRKTRRWAAAPMPNDEMNEPAPAIRYCGPPAESAPSPSPEGPFAILAGLAAKLAA